MSKNLVILEGSPRKKGNSCVLAAQAAASAREAGAEVTTFHLHTMKIAPCNGCDGCKRKGVYCTTQDDMQLIYPKIHSGGCAPAGKPNLLVQLHRTVEDLHGSPVRVMEPRPQFFQG